MTTFSTLEQIYHDILRRHPEAQLITLSLPEKRKGVVQASIRTSLDVRYNTQRYQFDQFTGKLLNVTSFDDKMAGEKLRAMNYDIHVGAILGPTGKLLAFFVSLISASLPVTGFLIWYGRRYKKVVIRKAVSIRSAPTTPISRPTFTKSSAKTG